jgi:hypothetical protein
MFALLRLVRGFFGLVFAFQVVHVIEALALLLKPELAGAAGGALLATLLFKAVILLVSGLLFFWLRGLINRLHAKRHGVPHPSLAERKLAL